MNEFRMKAEHRIHVPQFDEEHRQLFEIVNMLRKALIDPDCVHSVRNTFAMLENHARVHFANEEGVMQQCAYPGFHAHRQIHRKLLAQLAGMVPQFNARRSSAKLFNTSIAIWLTKHITTEEVVC